MRCRVFVVFSNTIKAVLQFEGRRVVCEMCDALVGHALVLHLRLQACPLQGTLRKTTWSEDLPLAEKLYGDLAAHKEDGSMCASNWCFRLAVVIEEEEEVRTPSAKQRN